MKLEQKIANIKQNFEHDIIVTLVVENKNKIKIMEVQSMKPKDEEMPMFDGGYIG